MRISKRIIMLIVLALICVTFTGCISDADFSTNYGEIAKEGSWEGALDRKHSRAFVSSYYWDGTEEGKRIEPSMLDNCTVTKYGGYFGRGLPMPFAVIPLNGGVSADDIASDADIEDVTFTLVVNPEIRDLILGTTDVYYTVEKPDGTDSYCHIVYEIKLDDANTYFEIKDGHLYNKSESEIILESIPASYLQN